MSNVVFAINIVRMIAPTVGAALLGFGGWRTIYLVPVAGGFLLLVSMWGFNETARIDANMRLSAAAIVRGYVRVLAHPVCVGNILCTPLPQVRCSPTSRARRCSSSMRSG
jgi:DHA1 family bicyclomycin/chloramphenicol resistance-like MFS transporter